MRIKKITGFEGGEFERLAKSARIMRAIPNGNWCKVYYKMPRGRKEYSMMVRKEDLEVE